VLGAGACAREIKYGFKSDRRTDSLVTCCAALRWSQGRVREIKYDFDSDRVAALGTEGCIKLFDLERDFRTMRTVRERGG
jgi:hypothetical protein